MIAKRFVVISITIFAALAWSVSGISPVGNHAVAPPEEASGLGVPLANSTASAADNGSLTPAASTSSMTTAGWHDYGGEMADRALAAVRAAGLKPDIAYVPRPSATPSELAAARQNGSAVPLYTGDPAPMGLADYGLASTGDVFVGNYGSNSVIVINGAENTVVATVPVGIGPNDMAYDGLDSELYVPDSGSNNVTVVSTITDSSIASIPVGNSPYSAAYDSRNGNVYVDNFGSGTVSVISPVTNLTAIEVGTGPSGITFDSENGDLYVTNSGSDTVSVISGATNSVVAIVPVGVTPSDMAYDSANGDVYVANYGSSNVSVISGATNKVIATVPAGTEPNGAAYDGQNGYIYISNTGSMNVSVISGATNNEVTNVTVGGVPEGVGFDPENGAIYVADGASNCTTVINGATNMVVDTVYFYGVAPLGVEYGGGAYTANTTDVLGIVDANATGIQGDDLYQALPDGFSIQLNAILTNVTLFGQSGYQFWAQDIITYFPANGSMLLVTNVWNWSGPNATMTANSIYMHGPYGTNDYSSLGFYYASYTVPYRVSYPFDATLEMTSSVNSGDHDDELVFDADVFSPSNAFREVDMYVYDFVDFNSNLGPTVTQPSNFTVSGTGYNKIGLLDDLELDVCGPGGGSQVDLSAADATLALSYVNEAYSWQEISSAYNYGSDTGETSTGANVAWSNNSAFSPGEGLTQYATMTTGPSVLSGLWGTGAPEGSFPVVFQVTPANAFLFFSYTGTSAFTGPFVSEFVYAPTMETTTFYLMNGTYDLHFELADYGLGYTYFTISGAPWDVDVQDTSAPSLGVYTPLWAFSNAEVKALAQSGDGSPTDPYVLFNNQYAPLSSDFGLYNDYSFPVFPGVFLQGTTASVLLNNSSTFETYTNDFQSAPGPALPPTNDLQFWFWNVSGVALVNDSNISGWFGLENYFPLTYNSFNVIFYASEGNLVANNFFLTQSQGLLMYANGTFFGPSVSVGGHNTVWGNGFVQVSPPMGCPGPAACLPLLPYNSGLGLEIGEGSDLIYNNFVATPTTAWLLPLNLYTETPATWTHDNWNLSTTEPANYSQTVPGFPTIPLYGSVVGGSTQGGNSWWDYGVAHNWANDANNPLGVIPYNEDAPSLIDPASGYGSPLPGYPCPHYYCASYIYPGGDYLPLATDATAVSLGPQGLVGNVPWGVVISCQPAHSGGGGPAHSGGGGPAHSGGGGPCSASSDPASSGSGDPAKLILAAFESKASVVHLVLPDGAYEWTPIATTGYTTSTGGSFAVTAAEPVTLVVPYSAPGSADFTFAEAGLPSGLTWSVTVSNTSNTVTKSLTTDGGTDTLAFGGPSWTSGSYSYTIGSIPGWGQSTLPYSGTVTGGTVSEPVLEYTQGRYSVVFFESGLPSGLSWQVTVNGIPMSYTTDGSTDSLTWTGLINGVYSYSITNLPGWSQAILPYSGTVTVSGGSVTEPTLAYVQVTYTVLMSESGLPSGLTWQVTVDGLAKSLSTTGSTGTLSWSGLPNGTYPYSITGNPGWHEATLSYSGSLTVIGDSNSITGSGVGYSVTLVYSQVTYSVVFSESGLPSGLTWQVTVGGVAKTLTTNGLSDSLTWNGLANGSYAYSIPGNPGWHQTTLAYTGKVVVNGASVTEPTLVYGRVAYSVTISEAGLPAGLTWKVTVNGVTESLTTNGGLDWLTWTGLANGTYAYSIVDNPGWHQLCVPYSGKIVVNGASLIAVLAYYQVTYSVTFSESGLSAGLTWTVTVGGVTKSLKTDGHTDSLTWTGLPNGTYAYTIKAISGWTQSTLPSTGNVVVKGASVSEPTLKYTK